MVSSWGTLLLGCFLQSVFRLTLSIKSPSWRAPRVGSDQHSCWVPLRPPVGTCTRHAGPGRGWPCCRAPGPVPLPPPRPHSLQPCFMNAAGGHRAWVPLTMSPVDRDTPEGPERRPTAHCPACSSVSTALPGQAQPQDVPVDWGAGRGRPGGCRSPLWWEGTRGCLAAALGA